MGAICSRQQTAQDFSEIQPLQTKIEGKMRRGPQSKQEAMINGMQTQLKLLENKIKVQGDKLREFINQSIGNAMKKAKIPKITAEEFTQDKLDFLEKCTQEANDLQSRVEQIMVRKKQLQNKFDGLIAEEEEISNLENLYHQIEAFEDEIVQVQRDLNDIEHDFKQAFKNFVSYKDTADYIDIFEESLIELLFEYPKIEGSLQSIIDQFNVLVYLVQDGIHNNVNFSKSYQTYHMERLKEVRDKYEELVGNVTKMLKDIMKCDENRTHVIKKNFSDAKYVAEQHMFITGIQSHRLGCKKLFKKFKKILKKAQDRYIEMTFEEIQKALEEKFNTTFYTVKEFEKYDNQQNKQDQQMYQDSYDEFQQRLKVLGKKLLVCKEELLRFREEEKSGGFNIQERYAQNKQHMKAEELDVFYNLRKELVRLKTIYNSILMQANKFRFDPEDEMFDYQVSIKKFENFSIELENLPFEAKMITVKIDKIPIPLPPAPKVFKIPKKFDDEVDRLLYEYLEFKKSQILIRKISPNNYFFGTKRIYVKVNNGLCLIRVGGGFMDVAKFYDNYAESEMTKQDRHGIKDDGSTQDQSKNAIKFIRPVKEKDPGEDEIPRQESDPPPLARNGKQMTLGASQDSRNNPDLDLDDISYLESNSDNPTTNGQEFLPQEYEIDLIDDDEEEDNDDTIDVNNPDKLQQQIEDDIRRDQEEIKKMGNRIDIDEKKQIRDQK
eukprot:403344547